MNTHTLFSVGTLSGDTKGGVGNYETLGKPGQQ